MVTSPVSSMARTTTSLAQMSSFLTGSPWTFVSPVVPSWPTSAARASSRAMIFPATASWVITIASSAASGWPERLTCSSSVIGSFIGPTLP